MNTSALDALSPLDGRYAGRLGALRALFSEAGLMRERVRVECAWLLALGAAPAPGAHGVEAHGAGANGVGAPGAPAPALAALPDAARSWLQSLSADPAAADIGAIKAIEARTNHDVKAVEVWLRTRLEALGATPAQLEWIHFGCTSEDINNLAYALMLKNARTTVLLPLLESVGTLLDRLSGEHAAVGMLARTHGQTATPTTVGKELANVAVRLRRQRAGFARVAILGKMNGAVGNFNAHVAALPQVDWPAFSAAFVGSLGLEPNAYTTQIEPHDWIAEYCHALMRIDTVLLDFSRDMWSYISLGYFTQRVIAGEVGSSTMPHKVNPIDFENAEGNFGIANALLGFFADKLPVSRLQRDLTDSTVLRNLGVAFGHASLALSSLLAGMKKVEVDSARLAADLDGAWEVLGEAVQTVMRAHGLPDAYERLKRFTRGRAMDGASMREFIASLELPDAEKRRLLALSPGTYLGLAAHLAHGAPGET